VNIQIYGKSKCFDTKKAERYFKERRVSYQFIDLPLHSMGKRELETIKNAVGGIDQLVDGKSKDEAALLFQYLASDDEKAEKLLENPRIFRTPIVRNGRKATVGYCPEVWKSWE